MAPRAAPFPGFTALNDQIFVRDGEESTQGTSPSPDHPRVVIIFSWGDALPKHVVKYLEGYRKLYPHAKQFAVLSPMYKAMTENLQQRADSMRPLVDAAYPPDLSAHDDHAVLIHGMSNTGGINYASALKAYHQKFAKPMPHNLSIWDSAPGSPYMTWETLKRWANAVALSLSFLPLPFLFTKCLAAFLLAANRGYELMIGREPAPIFSCNAAYDPNFTPQSSHKLYLYGKDDHIIASHEIEHSIAAGREKGYASDAVRFEGSGHVGHMRMFPEKYWAAIQEAWKKAA